MAWLIPLIPVAVFLILFGTFAYVELWKPRTIAFTYQGFRFSGRKIDRKTGFPALPKGWVWRTTGEDQGTTYEKLILELVDDQGIVRGSEVWYVDVYLTSPSATKKALSEGTRKILKYVRRTTVASHDVRKYYGEYPPKNINTV
jgi:hypothetical protein